MIVMTPLTFHILLALAAGDTIAWKIKDRIWEDVAGSMVVADRSFYAALKRLVAKGWIEATPDGREMRYSLLPLGRRLLEREKIRYGHAVHLLHIRL